MTMPALKSRILPLYTPCCGDLVHVSEDEGTRVTCSCGQASKVIWDDSDHYDGGCAVVLREVPS